jgi:hypothetical protein
MVRRLEICRVAMSALLLSLRIVGGRVMGNWVGVFIQYEGDGKGGCAYHG